MNKLSILLVAVILLCLCSAALAEGGVNVEVIKMDGVSVVVLTPEETVQQARRLFMAKSAEAQTPGFALPVSLTAIGEEAFAGIPAERVDVTESVVSIGSRAFADCARLKEITIPATVLSIDDHALEGCANVTVYGAKGSEAERFATAAGFTFVDPNAGSGSSGAPASEAKAAELPFVPAK